MNFFVKIGIYRNVANTSAMNLKSRSRIVYAIFAYGQATNYYLRRIYDVYLVKLSSPLQGTLLLAKWLECKISCFGFLRAYNYL